MSYINISKARAAIKRYPHAFGSEDSRRVGAEGNYTALYHDIIRFFDEGSLDPDQVKIEYEPGLFELADEKIKKYAGHIADELRRKGRLYQGPTVTGFRSLDLVGDRANLIVQETDYADFAGSCLAPDLPHSIFKKDGGTLRDYYLEMYGTVPAQRRPLANVFGVCGMLLVQDLDRTYLLKVRRAANLASMPDTLGPSAAGTVDYSPDYSTLADMTVRALGQEVEEELGLITTEYGIVPLALGHDIVRGDNPQIFCLINTWLDRVAITSRLQQIPADKREFSEFAFWQLEGGTRLPSDLVKGLNFEATMCYYMIEEYLQLVSTP